MNILYIGDIMGRSGMRVVSDLLPKIKVAKKIDLTIAQAENVSEGKGITPEDFAKLKNLGIDFCSGGNWSLYKEDIIPYLDDPAEPIIRPANYPQGTPGLGYKYINVNDSKVLVISLLGQIVGRDANVRVDNPLNVVNKILEKESGVNKAAIVVNFHGDFSSEKRVVGYFLDGRVSAVIGDHWHVPTADAMILPKGTAHITDVGMCGSLDSSLGVQLGVVIDRWLDSRPRRNLLEHEGRMQFNAVLITSDQDNSASSIEHIQTII